MNRVRSFAIAATLFFAISVFAQQTTTPGANSQQHPHAGAHHGAPSAEEHLKLLTEKLNLTADQQTAIKPALQELQDSTDKVAQNDSLTREQKAEAMHAELQKADKKMREVLTDEQKEKLTQLEQDMHGQRHQ